ncbi:histidine kinase [Flavobacterium jumunjinense]|uniref:Histidine kinase n=1 Tax=Flavobacterium jumunjinense TaxID=998845 RepID=A0ABV5GN17_9FLAO
MKIHLKKKSTKWTGLDFRHEDLDLASDFVTRLSSCYRYILENNEEDLVSLDKELNFLDSFIFMMDVRHKISLKISTK